MRCPKCGGNIYALVDPVNHVYFECNDCIWNTCSLTELFELFTDHILKKIKEENNNGVQERT
jgi:hypothetical protein